MHKRKQRKIIITTSFIMLFLLTVVYASFNTNINLKAKGNIKEKSQKIQRFYQNSKEDFHSDFYKKNIENITFSKNTKISSNAKEIFDISEAKDGGVVAYTVENTNGKYDLFIVSKNGIIANEDSSYFFDGFVNLKTINFNNSYDTKNVKTMARMFQNCKSLKELNLESFNTANVTNMNNMFDGAESLEVLNIKSFNTQNVTDMGGMFYACRKLKTLNLSNFDTSNVTIMTDMFSTCTSLTEINLASFNTKNVINMSGMFFCCQSLTSLNLNNFNTEKVTNMSIMFAWCSSLKELNLCSFDITNVNYLNSVFAHTQALEKITANWDTTNKNTENMFLDSKINQIEPKCII